MSYVRSNALGFLDLQLGSKRIPPSSAFGEAMTIFEQADMMTDEDEAFLEEFDARLKSMEEGEKEAAAARGRNRRGHV